MSTLVFVLMHTHELSPEREDFKLIGVYSTKAAAESAVKRIKVLPGFSETPEGFCVQAYPLDKDHWTDGFVTVGARTQTKTRKAKRSRGL